jgi:hypothetical protein
VGAYVSAPGYIVPGTTLIKFPEGVVDPNKTTIILSQKAISTTQSIPIKIDAAQMTIPWVHVGNPNFEEPPQDHAPYYTPHPTGPKVFWSFTGSAGIAANNSILAKNNPAPGGTQVGFITGKGSISQSVRLQAHKAYAVSFLVAEQLLDNGSINAQTLEVRLDNTRVIGTFKPSNNSGGRYVLFTSDAFAVVNAAVPHTITITGMVDNNTALIDLVNVTGPSSGQGVVGDFVPGIIAGRVLTTAGVPLAGFRVFLDLNGDGRFDAGDRSVLTNALGAYAFAGLGPGTYVVREVVPLGWHLVAPAGGSFSVLVTSGRRALGLNFWDFHP